MTSTLCLVQTAVSVIWVLHAGLSAADDAACVCNADDYKPVCTSTGTIGECRAKCYGMEIISQAACPTQISFWSVRYAAANPDRFPPETHRAMPATSNPWDNPLAFAGITIPTTTTTLPTTTLSSTTTATTTASTPETTTATTATTTASVTPTPATDFPVTLRRLLGPRLGTEAPLNTPDVSVPPADKNTMEPTVSPSVATTVIAPGNATRS